MYQLRITRPGSLLSVVRDQEITPAQVSIIEAILKAPSLTYGEVLAFLALRQAAHQPAWWDQEVTDANGAR